jgi:cell division protein FtsL
MGMLHREYILLIGTTITLIFFHIYHESKKIKLFYALQKVEQIYNESKLNLEEAELKVQALKNRESSTKWAIEHGMQDVKLSSIKKWQP